MNKHNAKATNDNELSRKKVAAFINASDYVEIAFTRNATEAISLVVYSWGLSNLKSGDEVILTVAEHHSAIVPWQLVAQKTGVNLKFLNLNDDDESPDLDKLKEILSRKTKLVVIHHISNMLSRFLMIDTYAQGNWLFDVNARHTLVSCSLDLSLVWHILLELNSLSLPVKNCHA